MARARTSNQAIWTRLSRIAKTQFGIHVFRPGQRELISAVLEGRDAIGLLPTGAGKSLCFQLPAVVRAGTVVVVSPLISLIKDQHEHADHANVQAVELDSTLSRADERAATEHIRRGDADIVYVTPERLENPEYLALLAQMHVQLFVVDEAHCVSQWGHDFRPAYLTLRDAVRALGRPPILALTATAPADVQSDIARELDMKAPVLVNTGVERENLFLEVFRTPSDEVKHARLLDYLREAEGSGIVYASTVQQAVLLFDWLERQAISVSLYHGKLTARRRAEAQASFMNDDRRVMVATNAFGMGIDKPDVRFVVHWNVVDSIETYLQEAGRAGRDGKPARASLLFKLEDKRVQQFFLGGKHPTRDQSARVYAALPAQSKPPRGSLNLEGAGGVAISALAETLALPEKRVKTIVAELCRAGLATRDGALMTKAGEAAGAAEFDRLMEAYEQRRVDDRQRLEHMMRYAQSTECRSQMIRTYFGETPGEPCGRCDNCRDDNAHALAHSA